MTDTIVGPCVNHPKRPGAWLLQDGTWRCDPCGYALVGVDWPPAVNPRRPRTSDVETATNEE